MASRPAVAAAESATATRAVDLEPDLVGDVFFFSVSGVDESVDTAEPEPEPEEEEPELAEWSEYVGEIGPSIPG